MGEPNLRVLHKSRRRPREGDIFALSPRDDLFVFGRVVSTEATWAQAEPPPPPVNLIYVYRHTSPVAAVPPDSELQADKLLIPPAMVNKLPWSRGYFQTIGNIPLRPGETLGVHCFRDARGRYFNEFLEPLAARTEPYPVLGLGSYRTVDDQVCEALGIPLAD
ncbi:immunity 26/phosphotriesterase HocA family protein [Saccharothrix variisporea]|uniref:Immunity protein 26 of polymorphic toxin system n=1 Tax=Saccharothrix variisporea TaxID=543527 RepID=A0A495X6I8_9PSEU|nr:immunity 26/phosphotriesterase HocA family protein [Saccharothrix variisporea]RKT69149.1 immunity protein 26 of polymorphic toxin system [Saccharothrix variisporea]